MENQESIFFIGGKKYMKVEAKQLGQGATAKVFKAYTVINDECQEQVALKVFDDHTKKSFLREVELLTRLKHENVIKLLSYTD